MTKRLFVVLIALVMTAQLQGCSSGGSKDDGAVAESNDQQFSQEGEGDFAQGQADVPQDQIAQDGSQQSGAVADAPPQDMGQDLALDGQQQKPADGATDVAAADQKPKDELSLEDPQPLPEDIAANPGDPAAQPPASNEPAPPAEVATAAPPTDEPLFKNGEGAKPEEAGAAAAGGESMAASEPAPAKVYAPLLKVKEAAFNKNGTNLNRVYLGRQGDKWKSVSQKLYGKNRTKELKAWNAGIAGREVKVGDKVYYQSPNSPDDNKMLTYYEDMGLQPRVYSSKEGDDIRKVSKDLLGSGESWKEVWATNQSVESKNKIPGGLEIKYWPEDLVAGAAAAPHETVAQNNPPPDMAPPPPMDIPPAPPADPMMNANNPPPPPPGGGIAPASTPDMPNAAGTAGMPPQDMAPPPPPPPPVQAAPEVKPIKKPVAAVAEAGDPDSMMIMGLGGILLMAAAVIFVVLKKNRAKRVDLGQTQV